MLFQKTIIWSIYLYLHLEKASVRGSSEYNFSVEVICQSECGNLHMASKKHGHLILNVEILHATYMIHLIFLLRTVVNNVIDLLNESTQKLDAKLEIRCIYR